MPMKKESKKDEGESLRRLVRELNKRYRALVDPDHPDLIEHLLACWGRRQFFSGGPGVVGLICEELCRRILDRKNDIFSIEHDDSSSTVQIMREHNNHDNQTHIWVTARFVEVTCWTLDRMSNTGKSDTKRRFEISNPRLFDDVADYAKELDDRVRAL